MIKWIYGWIHMDKGYMDVAVHGHQWINGVAGDMLGGGETEDGINE